ncbi:MAG: hypothetical protein JKY27_03205 [Magnetovibrio sp.]|nr:hypothetical protein [Magnetovibrio sp.]
MTPKSPEVISQKRRHARSRAMAQVVVSTFTERLKEEAQKHGGSLSQRHIDELNIDFQAKAGLLTRVFEQAFSDAAREQEELKWHAIKRPAFDRLIVKRFEQLFIQRGVDSVPHGTISRRILPGFFLGLNMMLGPEALERYQWRCDTALERIMKGRLPVGWNLVDQDAEVHTVILDAQYAIALHFEDVQHRSDWFVQIANAHLAPISYADAPDAQWELTPRALRVMAKHLLGDLKKAVDDNVAWQHLAERHEGADRHKIALILERLD